MQRKTLVYSLLAIFFSAVLIFTGACSQGTKGTADQILRVNLAGDPDTIDPNQSSWEAAKTVISQVFEGMLAFNQDETLRADVATVIPTVANKGISADGLTYTFKLKTNVTWSDGQKLTARDFVYSIKRLLNPDLACPYASFYFDIVGGEAYFSATDKSDAEKTALANAVGVSAPDDYTLEIKLNDPLPSFLNLMALWPAFPEREDIITKYGNNWTDPPNFIGNGPYILTEWVHEDHYVFKVNPNYWGTKPKLTEIDFKDITDPNAAIAAYKNNELDMVVIPAGTEKTFLNDASYAKERLLYNELSTFAFQFNVTKPPFDNKLVRQALSCAIDRDAFINQVRSGVGTVALSWIPPGMPGYDATIGKEWAFNVTKAKQLLTQAGYSDVSKLPQITFSYANTGGNTTIAQFLQGQMQTNLGINITLDPQDPKAFSSNVTASKFMWANFGWGADYPDPDDWLPQIFGTGAGVNECQYSSSAFDALAATALKEQDNTKRLADWNQAQKIVMDDAPIVTIFYRERFYLVKTWVKGLKTTGMDGGIAGDTFFNEVYIAK
jgi:oligopeptide transport system substrate-binding protein